MPPKTVTVTINADDLEPNPVHLAPGDHVNWHNKSGVTVKLILPRIFSPPQDPTIENGQTSRNFTVNNGAKKGDHEYHIETTDLVPRNGTIDVT